MSWAFVILIIGLALVRATTPKPQNAKPPGIGDINRPTSEEGRNIPVLFGTRWIKGPNVVWDGDFKFIAIKKKP